MKPTYDWPAIRAAFETEVVTQREIGERFSINPRAIRRRAASELWVRCPDALATSFNRRPRPERTSSPGRGWALVPPAASPKARSRRSARLDPQALVISLHRTTARAVEAAEARFATEGAPAIHENDLRTLGALAAMLAKVIALDASPRSPRDDHSAASPAHGRTADKAETGDKVDFDDPRQRDAFSERLERFAAERAAGDAVAADRVGAPEP
jgi:hypothetical protein